MRISVPVARLGFIPAKFITTAMTVSFLAGCSDSIDRFAANYNNPSDADPVYTASVQKYQKPAIKQRYVAPQEAASNEQTILQSPIASAPLSTAKKPYDYTKAYKQPKLAYTQTPETPVYQAPVYKASTYKAPAVAQEQATAEPVLPQAATAKPFKYKKPARIADASMAQTPMLKRSTTTVQVGKGMTMYSIAKANSLSVQQLASANNIAAPYALSKGRVLNIPGKAAFAQAEPVAAPGKTKAGGRHAVAQGDTLFSLGRKYGVSPYAIADLNGLPRSKALAIGQDLRIPSGAKTPAAIETAQAETPPAPDSKIAAAPLALPKADAQPTQIADATPPTDAAGLSLRWPVKGKVISEFGAKPNGLRNEGINIAVPEGTGIRAAEGGVVAYAGNELKGYGNLVLIRHAGGYVTAYAHASQLLVKRGDTVKRGDVIAKAGQTGAVQSPQLHFEVRKGASALDPKSFLNASTAMN